MKNTVKTVSAKAIKVQTYLWERFGNNIVSAMVALCELIHNAYAACMHVGVNNRVDVNIITRKSGTYLYVKNNGITADLQRVLDYGRVNHGTVLNQWGTGFKTAASFFNPSNNGWAFYTRDDEHVYRAKAPFSDEMMVEELEEWPFDDWAVSCVEIKIAEHIDISCITAEEIGYRYAYAINDGLNLNFNKRPVRPISPVGAVMLSDAKMMQINGEEVKFEYEISNVKKSNRGYFDKNQEDQGVYVYVNNCLAEKVGVSIIKKRHQGGGFLKTHPAINGMICTINICVPDNHKADLPFINAKCNINWKSEIGKEFVSAINDCIGEPFYKKWREGMESERREYIDLFCSALSSKHTFYYAKEVNVGNSLRADAVLYADKNGAGKPIMNTAHTVLEFKAGKITGSDVGQAFNYLVNLNCCYPSYMERRILLIGHSLTSDAKCVIEEHKKNGYNIGYIPYGITKEEIMEYNDYMKTM